MNKIIIYGDMQPRVADVSSETLINLKRNWETIISIYEFYLQYTLVCSSLADFKKSMYARAVDMHEMPLDQQYNTSASFVAAENSTMYMVSSLLKFTDLLPSLYSKCFKLEPGIYAEYKAKFSAMHDDPDRKYMFLCELRNAIVHNKVSVTVSQGASRKLMPENSVLHFGYYLDLDKFVEKHVDKKHKREKLMAAIDLLCDSKGRVDLAKVFSDVVNKVYEITVVPLLKKLVEQLAILKEQSKECLLKAQLVKPSELELVEILNKEELIYSASVLARVCSLSESTSRPINATCIVIAPSIIK